MIACPFCRARLSEADVQDSRCPSCGQALPDAGTVQIDDDSPAEGGAGLTVEVPDPEANSGRTMVFDDRSATEDPHDASVGGQTINMDSGLPFDPHAQFGTMQFDESFVSEDSGRTINMDGGSPPSEMGMGTVQIEPPVDAGMGTVNLDGTPGADEDESSKTFMMDEPSDDHDSGRTINMDSFESESPVAGPGPAGGPVSGGDGSPMGTVAMDAPLADLDSGATVRIPEGGIDAGADDAGTMRTINMSGDFSPMDDASMKTFDMSQYDASLTGGQTMADISQSALFDKADENAGGSSQGSSRAGSGSGSSQPSSGFNSSGSAYVSDSSVGSLKGLSDATGDTFVSDEWADPGINATMAVPGSVEKRVEQVVKTIWMEAANEKPGTSLKGRESKKAVKPATGTPLVIKPRVLKKREESVAGEQVEYELLKVLGEGGMGVVYDARQTSIDRGVALKMLKGGTAGDDKQRQKFLAEAVVTGDLDHPNIVPIYDVGTNDLGHLFYSMKKVEGTPWHKLVAKKSQAENIEILMKVADAVAFAHNRGVIHRDLKPENVMLGSFGEVLVMDWGLAQSTIEFKKRSSITESAGMGGTPAYMAPEMATGPMDKIGKRSDVYLLGAILYEIVTGKPPHSGKNAMMCLMADAKNEIVPTDKSGELVDVALKAMATRPEDRYESVSEFQNAIRDYVSHSESIALSTRAVEDLETANRTDEYQDFAKAMFGFQEAIELWSGNSRAREMLQEVKLKYAGSALRKGDYDLGASLLDANDTAQAVILERIKFAVAERERRQQRLKVLRNAAIGLVSAIFIIVASASVVIYMAKQEADRQRGIAVSAAEEEKKAKKKAEESAEAEKQAKLVAVQNEAKAIRNEKLANEAAEAARIAKVAAEKSAEAEKLAKIAAVENEKKAIAAKEAEQYEAYVARIGLASAKIKENAFETALALLEECRPRNPGDKDYRDWEWGRLMHLCGLKEEDFNLKSPVDAVAMASDGKRFIAGTWGSHAAIYDVATRQKLFELPQKGLYVHSAAFSRDGNLVATGGSVGNKKYDTGDNLTLWDAKSGKPVGTFKGHTDAVVSIVFSKDGKRLLTSSYDKTAILWDVATRQPLDVLDRHTWTVWSAAFSPDEKQVVTASSDGTCLVWTLDENLTPRKPGTPFTTRSQASAPFTGHKGPVFSASFSPDGRFIASGGQDRRVLLWQPTNVKPYDFEQIVADAARDVTQSQTSEFVAFEGHNGPVRSVVFSDDGRLILTSAGDNTSKLWDVQSRTSIKTLRGHDQVVQKAVFTPDGKGILTASHDGHVMLWTITGREEFRVLAGKVLEGHVDEVLAAEYSNDGRSVVTASRDRTARTWELESGKLTHLLKEGHEFLASAAIFFPGGQRLLTAAIDGTVRVWNVDTGTETLRLDGTGQRAAVALTGDGKWIITGGGQVSADGNQKSGWKIQVWNGDTGEHVRDLIGHATEVTALAVSKDGQTLVSGDLSGEVLVWNLGADTVRHRITGHNQSISAIALLPNGSRALVASADSTVGQWDLGTGLELPRLGLKHLPASRNPVLSLDVSPDGRKAVTTCADGKVRVWNVEGGEVLQTLDAPSKVQSARFSPDGERVAGVESESQTIHLWNVADGKEIGSKPYLKSEHLVWAVAFAPNDRKNANAYLVTVGGNEGRLWTPAGTELMEFTPHGTVASADFSPNGEKVVTGSWDSSARIWDAKTGKALLKLEGRPGVEGQEGHTANVNSAMFSPDGLTVLTASDDKTAKLWDAETGRLIKTFRGHQLGVMHAVFSDKGKKILTASNDKTARLWDVESGKTEKTFGSPQAKDQKTEGHVWGVRCAALSGDGSRVVTGSDDNSAIVWSVETGKIERVLAGHTAAVVSVAFSPEGQRILTGSSDNNAKLWDAGTGKEILTLDGHAREVTSVCFSPDGQSVLTGSRDGTARVWMAVPWKDAGEKKNVAGK